MNSDKLFTIPALQSLFKMEPLRPDEQWKRRCRSSVRFLTWSISLYNLPGTGVIFLRSDDSLRPRKTCSHFPLDTALVRSATALAPRGKMLRDQWIMAFIMASCIASPQRRGRWFCNAKGMMHSIELALVAEGERALLGVEVAMPSLGAELAKQRL